MRQLLPTTLVALLLAMAPSLGAEEIEVTIHATAADGTGSAIGTVLASDTPYGTLLTPALRGLSPGLHGFHVHTHPTCAPAPEGGQPVPGLAAGGHYDPEGRGRHLGPYAAGHLGDLPPLYAAADGTASLPVLAPRLAVSDLRGRSLMIHAGGDNYADEPQKLGGGGARVACGVAE
jgi:Cu-Zn family superoxide dismutase